VELVPNAHVVNLEEICPYQGGTQAQFFALINDKKGSTWMYSLGKCV